MLIPNFKNKILLLFFKFFLKKSMKKNAMTSSSSEYKELMTKTKNPNQLHSKMQTLMSYFSEWEQSLINREENFHFSQSKPKSLQAETNEDEDLCSNETLLNNFKTILDQKEQEIQRLRAKIDEKEKAISAKNKQLKQMQNQKTDLPMQFNEIINPLSDKTNQNQNSIKTKESQLKELNNELENKKLEVINMWDEVLLKAELLEKKEKEIETRKTKLELKQLEYENLVRKINEEKNEFFQNQSCKVEEERDREQKLSMKEQELNEKADDLEQKQQDFFLKTKKIHEMIKNLNKNLKNPSLALLLNDDLFSETSNKNLKYLAEELSSFETSMHRSSIHKDDDDIIDEANMNELNIYVDKKSKKINDIPSFCKNENNDMNLLSENSFDAFKNSMSFNIENNFIGTLSEQEKRKENNLCLPLQLKK